METRAPSTTRILIAVGFAISCFALALFLWLAFGGSIPLKPEGYRVVVPFTEGTNLATESDVRISGVSVGKVKRVDLGDDGFAEATIELDDEFAPLAADARAILRQKTLLGEIYVELTPGTDEAPAIEEGGRLAPAQVAESAQLDEVFRAFDPRTRAAFQAWMQGQAASLRGRGDDLSVAIASLAPFAEEAEDALRVLDTQDVAVSALLRESGEVFDALSEREGQLSGLIENANAVFGATADRDEELADAFTVFPTFLSESRETLARLERFARDTDPVVTALYPTARELPGTLDALGDLAPELDSFFVGLGRVTSAAPSGLRAVARLLDDDLPPLLAGLEPWLSEVTPIVEVIRMYRREVTSLLGNVSAAANGVFFEIGAGDSVHYVRTESPLGPEALAAYPRRLRVNRANPYVKPGGYLNVLSTMESFETRQCASGIEAELDPAEAADPGFRSRTQGDAAEAIELFQRLREFAFQGELSTTGIEAAPCVEQAPFDSIGAPAERSDYPHVRPVP